ncbi:MAG: SixA phosphatase family protein [Xanthobacteraceae bacterium]
MSVLWVGRVPRAAERATIAMRLMLLRHAKAEKGAPGQSDRERRLTPAGRSDAQLIGSYMGRHALLPQRVLVSPAQRTRETWDCIVPALGATIQASYDERLYNALAERIIAVAQETPSSIATLLMIGHNPGFHEAARLLVASGDVDARERLNESLPTAGLVVIDFAGNDWQKLHAHGGRLEHLVTPRSLAAAGRV